MPRVLEKMKEKYSRLSDERKAEEVQKVVDPLQAAWEKASVDDKPRLLREAKKEHLEEEESFVPLISECAAAILAGNRDFQKIYHAVYNVIRSGEARRHGGGPVGDRGAGPGRVRRPQAAAAARRGGRAGHAARRRGGRQAGVCRGGAVPERGDGREVRE